ncbi:MAG: ABC transporter substrate-binding protein [Chloroflexota bacterium]
MTKQIRIRGALMALALVVAITLLPGCIFGGKAPVSATDDAGRAITLKAVPQRIISGAPSNTEVLFALGLGDKLVGVDVSSDYPEAAKSIAKIGDCVSPQTTNFEQVVALKPDIFFAIKGQEKIVEELDRLGIPAYIVDSPTLADIISDIIAIGKLTGSEKKAAAVAADMQARVDAVAAKVKDLPAEQRPLVFYEVWSEPLMTAGPGTFVDSLINLAGGTNVAANAKVGSWPEYSLETLIKKDPAVIITTFGDAASFAARPGWAGIKAVKEQRVLLVDPNLVVRPGPRVVIGLESFAKAIHPELFK